MRRRWLLGISFLLLALALAGCQGLTGGSEQESSSESAINEATFIATEYAYQGPESVPAGWTRLTLDNQGELAHDLILVKLGEGKTMEDVMAALEAEGPPEWAQFFGGVSAQPGQDKSYLVDLPLGNYILLSFGSAEDAPPDAAQGMIANLTVTEAAAETDAVQLPEANVNVNLIDYAFDVSGNIKVGEQMLRVKNEGSEMHEMIVFRLKEGATLEDFQAALQQQMAGEEEPEGEPPFEEVGGTFLSPGVETYVPMEFGQAGNYVLVCFLPSPKNEMQPHFAMGMVREVAVQ